MDLSIIIVSWNVKEKLRENLKTIFITSPQPSPSQGEGEIKYEIFVVDNNSADGTVEMVKKEFSKVNLIANKENLGFAKANNQAIKQAQGKFILLLNPDMRVLPDTFVNMIKWMRENKQAVVAGCHLIDENGNTINHVRRLPTVWDQLAIVLKLPHIFPNVLNKYLHNDFDYSKPAKVDSVRGGFFMIRNFSLTPGPSPVSSSVKTSADRRASRERGAMKKMLLDERYFLWFEEVDLCRQVQQAGGEVWHTPAAQCVDYVGQSFKQLPRGTAQKYFRNSMLKYFKKWHPVWQFWLLKITWPVGMLLTWILVKLNFKSSART